MEWSYDKSAVTPANLENGLKQNRYISQAVVVGDRRPYLVALITLDPDEVPGFAQEHGLEPADVPGSDAIREVVQREVDEVNSKVGRVEQVKKFKILPGGPLAGDRRADSDAEGQAQCRQREVRGRGGEAVRRLIQQGRRTRTPRL